MTSDRTSRHREIAFGLAVAALLAISAFAPSGAQAAGCTDSWSNSAGGSWSTGSNWSKKAPPSSEEEACITEKGTYSVELVGLEVHVKSLTLGGTSGTQTLVIGSTCSINSVLAGSSGTGVGKHGAITLTDADSCGDGDTLRGPVTNAGTINIEAKNGGKRRLEDRFTNTGTINVNQSTEYNGGIAVFENLGALNVAEGKELAVSGESGVINAKGGKIAGGSTGTLSFTGGASFEEGAGTTSGAQPVLIDDGIVAYTGSGSSLIKLRGASELEGDLSSDQTLSIESTCQEPARVNAVGNLTNGGSIVETDREPDTCPSDPVTLIAQESGTLTNSGTITTEVGRGGMRGLEGNFENTGTIKLNSATEYSAGKLTNEGALDLAEGVTLTVLGGTGVTNGSGGKIVATGTAHVSEFGGTFTEGAGTTGGTQPVVVSDGTLAYTGSGSSAIKLRGTSTLSGSLSPGQTLSIESTCNENALVTAAASFTNGGSIIETNAAPCGNKDALTTPDRDTLITPEGDTLTTPEGDTLTNSGTITTELEGSATRTLQGNLKNTGTININSTTEYIAAVATLTNEGALNVAEGIALNVRGGSGVTNGAGGQIVATGTGQVSEIGGTFTEGAGKTAGSQPVVLDDGALNYVGTGASVIAVRGLSILGGTPGKKGLINKGQTLSIQSTCHESAILQTLNSLKFSNSGTIVETDGDTCGNSDTLTHAGETLENDGEIAIETKNGGNRTIEANVVNSKTVSVTQGKTLTVKGSYAQGSKGTFETFIAGGANYGAMSVSGAVALGGKLKIEQVNPFVAKPGEAFPIIAGGSLAGTFAKLSGNKIEGGHEYVAAYTTTTMALDVK